MTDKLIKGIGYLAGCDDCSVFIVLKRRPGYQDQIVCGECWNHRAEKTKEARKRRNQGFKS